jgi:hypothetical protein
MSFAEAAQHAIKLGGIYDGHDVNPDVHKATKQAVTLWPARGWWLQRKTSIRTTAIRIPIWRASPRWKSDVETGKYYITRLSGLRGRGHGAASAALGGQMLGRSTLGIGHAIGQKWVIDPQYGISIAERFYQNKPPTILDVPVDMQWAR